MPNRTSSCRFPTDVGISTVELADRYRHIWQTRMHGLNFLNPQLQVECAGFRDDGEHRVGVLITPWFMNLVLLPGDNGWEKAAAGDRVAWTLPEGSYEFRVNHDEVLGTFLSAVLFRGVTDIPDQSTARDIALDIMRRLYEPAAERDNDAGRRIGRRELLTGLRSD